MGTKTEPLPRPEPVPPGNQCSICWGEDKPFGDVTTPSKLEAIFSGIGKGEDWLETYGEPITGKVILEQVSGFPCRYTGTSLNGWFVMLNFFEEFTQIYSEKPLSYSYFGESSDKCSLFVLNGLTDKFIGGTCLIAIPEVSE